MASTISTGLKKVTNMNGPGSSNAKLDNLARDTYDSTDKNARICTDWGQKVSNTDHWLSVSNEDRIGPALMEDGHGREKVPKNIYTWWPLQMYLLTLENRLTDLIMSVFPSE